LRFVYAKVEQHPIIGPRAAAAAAADDVPVAPVVGFREEWTAAAAAARTQWATTTKGWTGMRGVRACAHFSISSFQYVYRAVRAGGHNCSVDGAAAVFPRESRPRKRARLDIRESSAVALSPE